MRADRRTLMLELAGGAAAIATSVRAKVSEPMLTFEPSIVTLKGTLLMTTFFGPPTFGQNPDTDSREDAPVLEFDPMIDIRGTGEGGPNTASVVRVKRVRVITSEDLAPLLGQRVTARGSLSTSPDPFLFTPVLFSVVSIEALAATASGRRPGS